jgi:hypothetical protein
MVAAGPFMQDVISPVIEVFVQVVLFWSAELTAQNPKIGFVDSF